MKNKNKKISKKKAARARKNFTEVVFLSDQNFRGKFYRAGEKILLPKETAAAYASRNNLKVF